MTVDTNFSMPAPDDTTWTTTVATTTTSSKASTTIYGYGTSTYPTPDQGKPIDGGGVPCVN